MNIIIFGIGVIVSLFCIYLLSEYDFIFLRKNITLEHIFNISFLTIFFGLLGGRVLSLIENFNLGLLYPGFSLLGGVLVGSAFVMVYGRGSKIPTGRVYDYLSFSALIGICISLFVHAIFVEGLVRKHILSPSLIQATTYGIFVGIIMFIFFPKVRSGILKEGSLGLIFLIGVSLISFFVDVLSKNQKIFVFVGLEGLLSLILFVAALFILLSQEKLFKRTRKI